MKCRLVCGLVPAQGAGWLALAVLPLALLWPTLRHAIEARMALHMLVELPVLFIAGASAGVLCLRRPQARWWLRRQRTIDWQGWTGATLVSSVALVWMLPSALDAALMYPLAELAKIAGWWLAGWMLADGWRRLHAEVLLFFVGNLAWMTATAGLLYVDAPVRLCVNYLQGDQRRAGVGLVVLAGLMAGVGLRRALRVAQGVSGPVRMGPMPGKANAGSVQRLSRRQ